MLYYTQYFLAWPELQNRRNPFHWRIHLKKQDLLWTCDSVHWYSEFLTLRFLVPPDTSNQTWFLLNQLLSINHCSLTPISRTPDFSIQFFISHRSLRNRDFAVLFFFWFSGLFCFQGYYVRNASYSRPSLKLPHTHSLFVFFRKRIGFEFLPRVISWVAEVIQISVNTILM